MLKPLHDELRLIRIVASTYQAISGGGAAGVAELEKQVRTVANVSAKLAMSGDAVEMPAPQKFIQPIAFNVLPYAGAYSVNSIEHDEGWTDEELRLQNESRKILDIPGLRVSGTCVRVPVYTGHLLSIAMRLRARRTLSQGLSLVVVEPSPNVSTTASAVMIAPLTFSPAASAARMDLVTDGLHVRFVGSTIGSPLRRRRERDRRPSVAPARWRHRAHAGAHDAALQPALSVPQRPNCATARRGHERRATGRGSSPGSRVCRASELGWRPCWLVCSGEPRSSAGDGGYTGRGEITSGSTCTCGGIPGPCVPSCRGDIIGLSSGASYSMARIERPVVLDLNAFNPSDPPCADCRRCHR